MESWVECGYNATSLAHDRAMNWIQTLLLVTQLLTTNGLLQCMAFDVIIFALIIDNW